MILQGRLTMIPMVGELGPSKVQGESKVEGEGNGDFVESWSLSIDVGSSD